MMMMMILLFMRMVALVLVVELKNWPTTMPVLEFLFFRQRRFYHRDDRFYGIGSIIALMLDKYTKKRWCSV